MLRHFSPPVIPKACFAYALGSKSVGGANRAPVGSICPNTFWIAWTYASNADALTPHAPPTHFAWSGRTPEGKIQPLRERASDSTRPD